MKLGENDIGENNLTWALGKSSNPELLSELVKTSRTYFSWFTKHLPRAFEYPWIAKQIPYVKDKQIMDIGSGVSPMPLFFANKGAKITTIDNSNTIRSPIDNAITWNEWGFFDYSILNKNIKSMNSDIQEVSFETYFDCIYSISVIEHMLSSTRRQLFHKISNVLKGNGDLLLTIDLIPKTEILWNYSEGLLVEQPNQHGNLSDIKDELVGYGFHLENCEFLRDLPDTRVDCVFLSLKKS